MNKSENTIQNEIRCSLSEFGIVIRLQSGMFQTTDGRTVRVGVVGLPDLMHLSFDGKVTFIECKSSTGKPSKEQINFIKWLKDHGFRVGIARNVSDALGIIGN